MEKKKMSKQEERRRMRKIRKAEEADKPSMVVNGGIGGKIANGFLYAFLVVIIIICVVPMWHVLMCSLSEGKALLGHSGVAWLPVGGLNLGGYQLLTKNTGLLTGYLNTILYVAGGTALGVLMNVVAGYVLSRETRWKPFMILFFVITTMFNGGTVPTYMVVRALGLTGTRWSLIIPGATNAMFILLVMNAFASVDKSYVEAAQLDGAGHRHIMFQVMLPQCKGMVMVTAINTAIMKWNSWFEASIYVPTQKDIWPLQLWVKELTQNTENFLKVRNPDYNQYLTQYTVVVIATAPILLALPFFIKRLEKGMVMGGVKG
ncbi:MAG: carbohydrate ABC transporter permease [Eubacteriales bacterium]|nr:carbohydrate ABC transporter permease [Eubacteriales bacterium]